MAMVLDVELEEELIVLFQDFMRHIGLHLRHLDVAFTLVFGAP